MEPVQSRWRNLLVLAALAGVAAAVYLLAPSAPPAPAFEAGVTELDRIWVQSGIDYAAISEQQIQRLSDAELDAVAKKLESFASRVAGAEGKEGAALRDYARIHLLYARELKARKRLSALQESARQVPENEVCARLARTEAVAAVTRDIVDTVFETDARVRAFALRYPSLAGKTRLTVRRLDRDALNQRLASVEQAINALRDACGP